MESEWCESKRNEMCLLPRRRHKVIATDREGTRKRIASLCGLIWSVRDRDSIVSYGLLTLCSLWWVLELLLIYPLTCDNLSWQRRSLFVDIDEGFIFFVTTRDSPRDSIQYLGAYWIFKKLLLSIESEGRICIPWIQFHKKKFWKERKFSLESNLITPLHHRTLRKMSTSL